jgi:hypothetical protein
MQICANLCKAVMHVQKPAKKKISQATKWEGGRDYRENFKATVRKKYWF